MYVNRFVLVLFALPAAVLLAGDLLLLHRDRQLRATVERSLIMQTGDHVPSLRGLDAQRQPVDVSYGADSRPTLLLAFSTSCDFCEENWPAWNDLRRIAEKRNIRVVGLCLGSPPSADYILQHSLTRVPLVAEVDPASMESYHLRLAPTTLFVSRVGVVEGAWVGVLRKHSLQEAEAELRNAGR